MNIDPTVKNNVYTQSYAPKPTIEGVKILTISTSVGEDSDFAELFRLGPTGELEMLPGFVLRQMNRSTQFSGSVKAWHLHFEQDELWYVPPESRLIAGLWDVRENSPTKNISMRIPMGGSTNRLIYIPRGVAHGTVNICNEMGVILYFVNAHFNKENPDEHRLPWDSLGADFWKPERD
jgi:dTDP-4-dehydrorhamnose 3,5-epimerase